ncbi:unnamed protein product [Dimorphilus gyrociliatus]|uniref:Uncharacterized protein n=1 Tax=Dimorphilus gyrociliatus TaxID=2664684 RepID=A0A7I8W1W8_9ANNE|nr:unnamed protein product [Dimorphilus gyrociliatus]
MENKSLHMELINAMNEIMFKRDELNRQIQSDDEEKKMLENDITILQQRLNCVQQRLRCNQEVIGKMNRILTETDMAYRKIQESSQVLVSALKKHSHDVY